ncbi:MAG: FAD:protein FMN transferase [Clostridiales bacterium]|nr:FAD:protein FMN transferase [Clostridiales bacterium]
MKKIFIVLLTFILSLLFVGCKTPTEEATLKKFSAYSFEVFDTVSTITGYEKTEEEFNKVKTEIFSLLKEYHRLFDIYKKYDGIENLYTINKVENGEKETKVDKKIIDMLSFSKEAYTLTKGNTNVLMGSVLSIWHDYREEGVDEPWNAKLPPMEDLEKANEHTSIENLVIDKENLTVKITDAKAKLDVGAIAKGYAVERVAEYLESLGKKGYLLNIGGNVRAIGVKGDGTPWLAGLEDPTGEKEFLDILQIKDLSIVTSGSWQRYYVVYKCSSCDSDGFVIENGDMVCTSCKEKTVEPKEYHHIIDKDTLMPSTNLTAVSVVTKDSGLGDALSTALFCMNVEEGLALVESLDGVEARWLTKEGETHYSTGFSQYIVKE